MQHPASGHDDAKSAVTFREMRTERIASPRNRLIVLLGAEAWCARCKALKPVFMQIAGQAPKHDVMLWLDIETHADFIGDYLPESLPERNR